MQARRLRLAHAVTDDRRDAEPSELGPQVLELIAGLDSGVLSARRQEQEIRRSSGVCAAPAGRRLKRGGRSR